MAAPCAVPDGNRHQWMCAAARHSCDLRNCAGVALPLVLVFAVCAFLTASTYVFSQMTFFKPFLKSPSELQALLNARSGAWIGLNIINSEKQEGEASSTDSLFGSDLFAKTETESSVSDSTPTLEPGGEPLVLDPYSQRGFGTCIIGLDSGGGAFRILNTVGRFRKTQRALKVVLGSRPFQSPDTVLFIAAPGMPDGGGRIGGGVFFFPFAVDSARGPTKRSRLMVMRKEQEEFITDLEEPLMQADSVMQRPPLLIKSTQDVGRVPKVVRGPLFIDATNQDVEWHRKRRVVVLGDLQFTGEPVISDIDFVVAGEIRVLDKSELTNVNLYSRTRIFFADFCTFSGQAIARGDIEIYNNAMIVRPATILTTGASKEGTNKAQPSGEGAAAKKPKFFSLFVRDQASVDGVLINLNPQHGIKTEMETTIRGILWAEGRVSHTGRMSGVIKAQALVNEDDPADMSKNFLQGAITPLDEIKDYSLPYFIGALSILSWKEQ
jgi:hypothetical protein